MTPKHRLADSPEKEPRKEKFNFETMKAAAMDKEASVRKQAFIEYYERFQEFPSFLFDNASGVDALLRQTIDDLLQDPTTTQEVRKGVDALVQRLAAA